MSFRRRLFASLREDFALRSAVRSLKRGSKVRYKNFLARMALIENAIAASMARETGVAAGVAIVSVGSDVHLTAVSRLLIALRKSQSANPRAACKDC